jgi:hypothetical protein
MNPMAEISRFIEVPFIDVACLPWCRRFYQRLTVNAMTPVRRPGSVSPILDS